MKYGLRKGLEDVAFELKGIRNILASMWHSRYQNGETDLLNPEAFADEYIPSTITFSTKVVRGKIAVTIGQFACNARQLGDGDGGGGCGSLALAEEVVEVGVGGVCQCVQPAGAVATDTGGNQATDGPDTLTVASSNTAPTGVAITAPAAGTIAVGTATTVTATATDADGAVAGVQFFANGLAIGSATAAPFSVSWRPSLAGTYAITAQATEWNSGTGSTKKCAWMPSSRRPRPTPTERS
jgi:hypothetical protein